MVFFFNRDNLFALLGVNSANLPSTLFEIIDIVIMSVAIAYIFEAFFHIRRNHIPKDYDPIQEYRKTRFHVNKESFKTSLYAIAPAVILHELMHKFVAIGLGSNATFYASYGGLALGVALRLIGSPIIFFVPGFVSHITTAIPWQGALIAFAGPFANLALWLGSWILLKKRDKFNFRPQSLIILDISRKINLFLFFFNMIPIAPFDGGSVFGNLIRMFTGV